MCCSDSQPICESRNTVRRPASEKARGSSQFASGCWLGSWPSAELSYRVVWMWKYNKQHKRWGVASLREKNKWKMSWALESSCKTLLGSPCNLYKISPICRAPTSMGAPVGPWWQDCRFDSAISWASNSPRAFVVKCWRMLYREYALVKKGTWKRYWQFAESVCERYVLLHGVINDRKLQIET